ncbi:MAG TPA: hypothetical protein ENJ52_11175 [Aliiroseovarius sp.]|nr:hypothetical protein [Aliiroseovarius sp.]
MRACRKAIVFSLDESITDPQIAANAYRQIPLAKADIEAFKTAIEYAEPENAQRLANLIRHYQVFLARLENLVTDLSPVPLPRLQTGYCRSHVSHFDRARYAADFAVLWKLANDVFGYARGETDQIPDKLSDTDLTSIFRIQLMLDEPDSSRPGTLLHDLSKELERRSQRPSLELGFH